MVVGRRRPELRDARDHDLRRFQGVGAVQLDQLVETAMQPALRRRAVVADHHVDQRVVEDLELVERVDQAADMVIGVFQEAGVDLHLARQHRLELIGDDVPGRDLLRAGGQLGVRRDHAELFLARKRGLALAIPARIERARVARRPFGWHVVRGMRGTGGAGPRGAVGTTAGQLGGRSRLPTSVVALAKLRVYHGRALASRMR